MKKEEFKAFVEKNDYLKKDLFVRGFLITDADIGNLSGFPFYDNWEKEKHGDYYFLTHSLTRMTVFEDEQGGVFFIVGHAYDPFAMEYQEYELLRNLSKLYGTKEYLEKINDFTGIFVIGSIVNGTIEYLTDPSGMQSAFCGVIGKTFCLTSHAQLVGDLFDLQMDQIVKELISYKWYGRVMGPYLPADLSPFEEVKRVVPSQIYSFDGYCGEIRHKRFWPLQEVSFAETEKDYNEVISSAANILKNNMVLVSQKWGKPWISLTGGIDSNTTFAAANGIYDKFETFSYISAEKEISDAEAAKKISERFDVKHNLFNIPNSNAEIRNFEERKELFLHNCGYVQPLPENELRKKLYLKDNTEFDVEVKSWVSETIRAYWYKHYNRKTMPRLSAKLFRNLYKIFTVNRKLAHKVDKLFEKYIKDYEYDNIPLSYPAADMHYNEVTWGSWGGGNISEMKYCFDITIIYNNRRFLDLMFRVPLEKRISDQNHLDMKRYLNQELFDMNIRVVNLKETKMRAFLLNVIFTINNLLP